MEKSKLQIRTEALEETMEAWKGRAFRMPKRDCLKLVAFAVKKMGIKFPKIEKMMGYKTPLQARAALKRVYGVQTVPDVLDKYFTRIRIAECLPGDIISMPGYEEGTLGAIGLYYGQDLVLCYEEEFDHPVIGRLTWDEGKKPLAAWRSLQ